MFVLIADRVKLTVTELGRSLLLEKVKVNYSTTPVMIHKIGGLLT